jgi:hypothetical protein
MSGIGFQKRFGDKTIGNLTLEAIMKPDIWKIAKMFAPDLELIPLTKSWEIGQSSSDGFLNLDGRFCGYFTVNHNIYRVGDSDNNYRQSIALLYDNDQTKMKTLNGFHGDDVLPMSSVNFEYTGFATGLQLSHNFSQPEHSVLVNFIGFKLGDAVANFDVVVGSSTMPYDLIVTVGDDPPFTVGQGTNHTFNSVPYGTLVVVVPDDPTSNIQLQPISPDYNVGSPYSFVVIADTTKLFKQGTVTIYTAYYNDGESSFLPYLTVSVDGGAFVPLTTSFTYTEKYRIIGTGAFQGYDPLFRFSEGGNFYYPVYPNYYFEVSVGHPLFNNVAGVDVGLNPRNEEYEASITSFLNSDPPFSVVSVSAGYSGGVNVISAPTSGPVQTAFGWQNYPLIAINCQTFQAVAIVTVDAVPYTVHCNTFNSPNWYGFTFLNVENPMEFNIDSITIEPSGE